MLSTSSKPQKPMHLHNSHSPTHTTNNVVWIVLVSNWHSHSSLNFAKLRPPHLSGDQIQTKVKDKQWLFFFKKTTIKIKTCLHCTFYTDRRTQNIKPIQISPSTHLCFNPSWHQVGICWFFNIRKFLQPAVIGQIFQTGPSGGLCEWLHNYWTKYEVLISLESSTECEHAWLKWWEYRTVAIVLAENKKDYFLKMFEYLHY